VDHQLAIHFLIGIYLEGYIPARPELRVKVVGFTHHLLNRQEH